MKTRLGVRFFFFAAATALQVQPVPVSPTSLGINSGVTPEQFLPQIGESPLHGIGGEKSHAGLCGAEARREARLGSAQP